MVALARPNAEVGARLSVDRDAAGFDQLIATTARADAGCGEEAVETQGRGYKVKRVTSLKKQTRCYLFNFVTFFNESPLRSGVRFRFGKADDFAAFLPLRALLEKFDALKAFQDIALGRDGAGAF